MTGANSLFKDLDESARSRRHRFRSLAADALRTGTRLRFRVCTYEEDFELEGTVQEAMRETIRNCSFLLVVSSKASAQSSHVRFELQTFRELHGADRLLAAQLNLLPDVAAPNNGMQPPPRLTLTPLPSPNILPCASSLHLAGGTSG